MRAGLEGWGVGWQQLNQSPLLVAQSGVVHPQSRFIEAVR